MKIEVRGDEKNAIRDVVCTERQMENGHVSVRIHADGSFDLFDKRGGRVYTGLNAWEHSADREGEYGEYAAQSDVRAGVSAKAALIEASAARAVYRLSHLRNLKGERDGGEIIRTESEYTLDADSPLVRISVREEHAEAERSLRALFPVGIRCESHEALTRSGLARRTNLPRTDGLDAACILLEDRFGGIAVCARGWFQYEMPANNTVSLTLTARRCAAVLGEFDDRAQAFEYAVAPYAAGDREGILLKIHEYLRPLPRAER